MTLSAETQGDQLLGWAPREAASRAVQALYGLAALALPLPEREGLLPDLAQASVESMQLLSETTPADCADHVLQLRSQFIAMATKARFVPIQAGPDRLWKLSRKRRDVVGKEGTLFN